MRVNALTFAPKVSKKAIGFKNSSVNVNRDSDINTDRNKEILIPPPNYFSPSFMKKYEIKDNLANEAKNSELARSVGISTPKITGSYEIKGEIADYKTNPVSDEQIKGVLKNILLFDKIGLYHGDLEKAHIFFTQGQDEPEFDCLGFGFEYKNDEGRTKWEFPDCSSPTSLYQFENNWLWWYSSQIEDEEKRDEFLRNYLGLSSDFHNEKANHLTESKTGTKEQIEFERLQAELYKNPSDELVDLFKDRLAFQHLNRIAFTERDEGAGACGHEKDETRILKGNLLYFEVLKLNVKYLEKIEALKAETQDEKTLKLLDYLAKYAEHQNNNEVEANFGRCTWSVNPQNPDNLRHKTPAKDHEEYFEKMYQGLKKATQEGNLYLEYDMLQMAQGQYGILINRTKS